MLLFAVIINTRRTGSGDENIIIHYLTSATSNIHQCVISPKIETFQVVSAYAQKPRFVYTDITSTVKGQQ